MTALGYTVLSNHPKHRCPLPRRRGFHEGAAIECKTCGQQWCMRAELDMEWRKVGDILTPQGRLEAVVRMWDAEIVRGRQFLADTALAPELRRILFGVEA